MLGRHRNAAPNEAVRPVVFFDPDERGAAMFSALTGNIAAHLNSTRPTLDLHGPAFTGAVTAPVQNFRGAANLGQGRPVVAPGTTLENSTSSTVPSLVQRVFEERMAEGRTS